MSKVPNRQMAIIIRLLRSNQAGEVSNAIGRIIAEMDERGLAIEDVLTNALGIDRDGNELKGIHNTRVSVFNDERDAPAPAQEESDMSNTMTPEWEKAMKERRERMLKEKKQARKPFSSGPSF